MQGSIANNGGVINQGAGSRVSQPDIQQRRDFFLPGFVFSEHI